MALPHSLDPLAYPARFQFGQINAPCNGASCCTDCCIQMAGEYWKEKTYPLYQIRKLSQAKTNYDERPCTGINHIEVSNALYAIGIRNYQVAFGIDANFVASKLANGPVFVGVAGGSYPNDSRCGGSKAEHGGRTQCDFYGAHMIWVVRYQKHLINGKTNHWDFVTRDPNHHSSARPEQPAFDRITKIQLDKAMKDLPRYTAFTSTYCLYPTNKKRL